MAIAETAAAHEFWIEPSKYQVESNAAFEADLRNGEKFRGIRQSFFPNRNTRIEIVMGDRVIPVEGRMGDRPAIAIDAPAQDGLLIAVHEAAPNQITYKTWEKFLKFADHKDFSDAASDHEARGWAKENFKETYTRHSKSLIAVGDGAGMDRALGLATEFVALDNPYDAGFDGVMEVALFYEGAPRADAQIEVYEKPTGDDGEAVVSIVRTDAAGRAEVPVKPGMEYLFDAVVLRPAADAKTVDAGPVWETLWAALTFAVPAQD
ncbi:DUF4198 domain-containing protein [Sulfitobacter sp. S190]|nr:DUF4198 domain-containing protein [Sulfitobacter sp. S190]